jgi:mevalonate kinase
MGNGIAYGKAIWMGEHAVVYGYPAFVFPIKEAELKAKVQNHTHDYIKSPFYEGEMKYLNHQFASLYTFYVALKEALDLPPLYIDITSSIPIASGMGSSAAIAAAMTKACYNHQHITLHQDQLEQWIHISETGVHGNPSGVDGAQMVSSQPIIFEKGSKAKSVYFQKEGFLLVVYSNEAGSTKEAVQKVSVTHQNEPKWIHDLGTLSKYFVSNFNTLSLYEIGNLMKEAHHMLRHLNLSTSNIEHMIELSYLHGALGSKLTGGGLGGMVMFLFEDIDTLEIFKQRLYEEGFQTSFTVNLEKDFI